MIHCSIEEKLQKVLVSTTRARLPRKVMFPIVGRVLSYVKVCLLYMLVIRARLISIKDGSLVLRDQRKSGAKALPLVYETADGSGDAHRMFTDKCATDSSKYSNLLRAPGLILQPKVPN